MKFKKFINILSIIIIVLAIVATLLGIFSHQGTGNFEFTSIFGEKIIIYGFGIYQYNSVLAVLQAIPHDIVTLAVGVPLLIFTLIKANKGCNLARFFLAGTLLYFLITYCMFTFIAMYNRLFIVYVLLMFASFYALLLTILSFDVSALPEGFKPTFPRKFFGYTLLISTSIIGLLWLMRVLPSTFANVVPKEVEHGTTLAVQAFDLAFFLPGFIISSILLLKNHKLGYLLAPIAMVAIGLIMMALLSKGISMFINGYNDAMPLLIMTSLMEIFSLINMTFMMKDIKKCLV